VDAYRSWSWSTRYGTAWSSPWNGNVAATTRHAYAATNGSAYGNARPTHAATNAYVAAHAAADAYAAAQANAHVATNGTAYAAATNGSTYAADGRYAYAIKQYDGPTTSDEPGWHAPVADAPAAYGRNATTWHGHEQQHDGPTTDEPRRYALVADALAAKHGNATAWHGHVAT